MEQIMCMLFVCGAVCGGLFLFGFAFLLLPEGAVDFLLKIFFGIKKGAAGERDTDSRNKLNNKDSVA